MQNKQRYISTSFWDDSWISELGTNEKLLYLYLLTNPLTNIAGVYKITQKRIAFDTGLKLTVIKEILSLFTEKGKACLHGEYIILPAWPQHQQWEKRSRIKIGIDAILQDLPETLKKYMVSIGYRYPINGYPYDSNYSDSDLDSDSDLNTDLEDTRVSSSEAKLDDEVSQFVYKEQQEAKKVPYLKIIAHLNRSTHKQFSTQNKSTQRLLKARWNEGYRIPDFQAVIDVKAKQWLHDPKMVQYLRPQTLFGSKFEGYLNESKISVEQGNQEKRCPECGIRGGYHTESCKIMLERKAAIQEETGKL